MIENIENKKIIVYDNKNKKPIRFQKSNFFSDNNHCLDFYEKEKSKLIDFINLFSPSYNEPNHNTHNEITEKNFFKNYYDFFDFIFDIIRIIDFESEKNVYKTLLTNINILVLDSNKNNKDLDLNFAVLELNLYDFLHNISNIFESNHFHYKNIFDQKIFSISKFFDIIFYYKDVQEYKETIKNFDVNKTYNYNLHLYNIHNKSFLINCICLFLEQKHKKFNKYFCYFIDEAVGKNKKEEIEFLVLKSFESIDDDEKKEILLGEIKENLYKVFIYREDENNTEKINTIFHLLGGESVSYEHCNFYYNFGDLKIIKDLVDFFESNLNL